MSNYGDVSDHDQCGELVQQAIDSFGQLDILVNNAGIVRDAAIWNMPVDDWDAGDARARARHVVDVALRGEALPRAGEERRRAARPHHQHHVGRGPGRQLRPDELRHRQGGDRRAHAHARAGAVPLGVTVNCIGPAGLTRITATMPGSGEAFEPDDVPEGEWNPMDPKNSSPVVAWLASDEADYVTGQVIRVIHDKLIWMGGWYERADVELRGQAVGRREARHDHGHRVVPDPPPRHGLRTGQVET